MLIKKSGTYTAADQEETSALTWIKSFSLYIELHADTQTQVHKPHTAAVKHTFPQSSFVLQNLNYHPITHLGCLFLYYLLLYLFHLMVNPTLPHL